MEIIEGDDVEFIRAREAREQVQVVGVDGIEPMPQDEVVTEPVGVVEPYPPYLTRGVSWMNMWGRRF